MSLDRCIDDVKKAAEASQIRASEWAEFARCTPEQQKQLWASRLIGEFKGRNGLAAAARKKRNGDTEAVRVERVPCHLPNGVQVVASGAALTLSDFITSLEEALKAARSALRDGLDSKVF